MISGTFKAGVQTLKPGDLLREHSMATGFIGDYVVLNAKIFPATGNTVYKLYILHASAYPRSRRIGISQGKPSLSPRTNYSRAKAYNGASDEKNDRTLKVQGQSRQFEGR